MGQGFSLTTLSAASANIDVPELAELAYEKTLCSGRFMKSIRARNQQGRVFVKAVVKPYPSFQMRQYVDRITEERNALVDVPNAIAFARIIETSTGGFLMRQYIHSSVYDRMSTRPFLEDIEKKWMVFQLLSAVRDCHARNIYHGDIKTENVLVTSWNWLYLTDFSSSFKPAYLPEDNPADFSFFFDTSGRRTCYLAPERFTAGGESIGGQEINWAMDIFSVGCVIAELFLEHPIFSLSQIFKYRTGDYSPEHIHLDKIEDQEVRDMILHMIKLNPEERYSADEYLTFYRKKIFPGYFYEFLHQYMWHLTDPSSGQKPVTLESGNFGESDDRIEGVYYDFDKISYFLGYNKSNGLPTRSGHSTDHPTPPHGRLSSSHQPTSQSQLQSDDGTLLFLSVVESSLRNTIRASARLKACDLLLAFAERLPDEAKLDRILPYTVGLLSDKSDVVRIAALRTMTQLLSMVEVVSPMNAYIFPEYIFPKLKQFVLSQTEKPKPIVRAAYASCLASLAQSSARILDMIQSIRADGQLPALAENDLTPQATYHGLFDFARVDLVVHFEEATKALITDPDSSVRRAFLGSVSTLCVFFGSSKTSDVILSHLNTYLNDKDWVLKCSFFEALVGVAAYVGSASLESFILPLMIQSLMDSESFVVEKVLRSLARMAAIGLFQRSTTWELIGIAIRFLVHPSIWIREAAVQFVVLSTKYVSAAEKYCIVLPMVQPFLKTPIAVISETHILDALKKPLPRAILEMTMQWATKTEKGIFWKSAARDAIFVLQDPESPGNPSSFSRRFPNRIKSSQRNEEDEQWLSRLRSLGMVEEDEMKLLALREYMWRTAQRKVEDESNDKMQMLNNVIALNEIHVTPQNIFFDNQEPIREVRERSPLPPSQRPDGEQRHTIADALLDASSAIEDNPAKIQPDATRSSQFEPGSSQPKDIQSRKDSYGQHSPISSSPATRIGSTDSIFSTTPMDLRRNTRTWTMNKSPQDEGFSPSELSRLNIRKNSDLVMQHRASAISLMGRKDLPKAEAATSTISENAFGKIDTQIQPSRTSVGSPLTLAVKSPAKSVSKTAVGDSIQPSYEPNHSYTGSDQNVIRLLDQHFAENFPIDVYDFGQIKHPLDPAAPIRQVTDAVSQANGTNAAENAASHTRPWRPVGNLLALFSEHTAAVNRVVAAPDHAFFVTASDDGTCKIWDTTRLEKNVTPRSRHTHKHSLGSKVKSLCFVENAHTFIGAADDGSIHVVKVDYRKVESDESTRYGKPVLVREYHLSQSRSSSQSQPAVGGEQTTARDPEYATWLHHYRSGTSQSILLILTTRSRLVALDLKTMSVLYILSNPLHHGTPTCFAIDTKKNWLVIGTSHGIFDMWDLRFQIQIRSWGLKSATRIDRVVIHPGKGKGRWILASSGGEMTVWDVEKVICREVYRPSSYSVTTSGTATGMATHSKPYEPYNPDEESTEKLLARFANALPSADDLLVDPQQVSSNSASSTTHPPSSSTSSNPPILAVCISADYMPSTTSNEPLKVPFLVTGGMDRTLRLWDINRPETSTIVSNPSTMEDFSSSIVGAGGTKPRYELSHPISANAGGQILLVSEILPASARGDSGARTASAGHGHADGGGSPTPSSKRSSTRASATSTTSTPRATTASQNAGTGPSASTPSSSSNAATPNRPPRSTVISVQQQALLRSHLDGITDVCVLQRPYGIIVSVDRGGGIYVFQ